MTTPARSQLAIPLSQNTAPVFKFDCLYTHDITRKQKRWQDGILAFHSFNKRIMVYDLSSNFIGDTHWRESDHINVGDDFKLDRGVLVEVGEARGRRDQDISEVFAKKTAPARTQASPLRSIPTGLNPRKSKSIGAVLGIERRPLPRSSFAPSPSNLSHWSSPVEIESPRPAKRPRTEKQSTSRQALAERHSSVQVQAVTYDNTIYAAKVIQKDRQHAVTGGSIRETSPVSVARQTQPSKPKVQRITKNQLTEGERSSKDEEHVAVLSPLPKGLPKSKSKSKRAETSLRHDAQLPVNSGEKMPAAKLNRKEKPAKTEKATSTKKKDAPVKAANSVSRSMHNDYAASSPEVLPPTISATTSSRPRLMVIGSKSKRKKLIFHDLSTNEAVTQSMAFNTAISVCPPESAPSISSANPESAAKRPDQSIIDISSDGEQELGISSDEEFYTAAERRAAARKRSANRSTVGSGMLRIAATTTSKPLVLTQQKQSPLCFETQARNAYVDDSSIFPDLLGDQTLLAAFDESPLQTRVGGIDRPGLTTADAVPADNARNIRSMSMDLALAKQSERGSTTGVQISNDHHPHPISLPIAVRSILSSSPLQSSDRPVEEVATKEQQEKVDKIPSPVLIPASPPLASNCSPPVITAAPAAINNAAQPIEPTRPQLPSIQAAQPAKLAITTTTPLNLNITPLAPQKQLPSFRPPTRCPVPVSNPNNNRLTTLARCVSDGGVADVVATVTGGEFDKTGAWSREAFDLFGWTPGISKGRVLGPVAGRGCGCRAAEKRRFEEAEAAASAANAGAATTEAAGGDLITQ